MRPDPNIGQGSNGDVEQDPDGFGITFRFYGWVLGLMVLVCGGIWAGGVAFFLGFVCGVFLTALLACFALGKAAPW